MNPRNYEDDYYDDYDDYDDYDEPGYEMSYADQMSADRSDWANERYERGEIDATQRAEIKAGA